MGKQPDLSTIEYATFAIGVLRSLATTTLAAVTGLWRGSTGAADYGQHLRRTFFRSMTLHVSRRQFQVLGPTTRQAYRNHAKKHNLPLQEVDVDKGTTVFWLGNKNAKTVLLWLHGGGYVLSAVPEYFDLLTNLQSACKDHGSELAIVFLEYITAPEAQYPHQLIQATAALRYLLEVEHRQASEIILGGDSAGAHLCLSLLSHISHPHAAVSKLDLKANLRGLILTSPWVTFSTRSKSYEENFQKDFLHGHAILEWTGSYRGGADFDYYNQPKDAPVSWWRDIKVDDILATTGAEELFRDDAIAFVKNLKQVKTNVTFLVADGEGHDAQLLRYMLGGGPVESEELFQKWIIERCK